MGRRGWDLSFVRVQLGTVWGLASFGPCVLRKHARVRVFSGEGSHDQGHLPPDRWLLLLLLLLG